MIHRATSGPVILLAALAAACATHRSSSPASVQAGSPDMASMSGHDMAARSAYVT